MSSRPGFADSSAYPPFELGAPGPLRDRLVAAVLRGDKTATSALRVFYEMEGAALPEAGQRFTMIDSSGRPAGTVEITRVLEQTVETVGDEVAHAEGEGFADAAAWRADHERFWQEYLAEVRAFLRSPDWEVTGATPVVVEYFRLLD